jgi:hypothetical protein
VLVLSPVPRQIPSGREMAAILELGAVLQRSLFWRATARGEGSGASERLAIGEQLSSQGDNVAERV